MYIWCTHHARVEKGRAGGWPGGQHRVGRVIKRERLKRYVETISHLESKGDRLLHRTSIKLLHHAFHLYSIMRLRFFNCMYSVMACICWKWEFGLAFAETVTKSSEKHNCLSIQMENDYFSILTFKASVNYLKLWNNTCISSDDHGSPLGQAFQLHVFFTLLYGVRNIRCPQISTQKMPPN
jgi:hypothetical protein